MTSNDVELIKKMLVMQANLNKEIMKEYNLIEITRKQLDLATLDEIGEFVHELKGEWCWWKKTQPKVDIAKALDELVDIWHFVLIHVNVNLDGNRYFDEYTLDEINKGINEDIEIITDGGLAVALSGLLMSWSYRLIQLIAISEYMGFGIQQIYEVYCEKNRVNYKRLREGY